MLKQIHVRFLWFLGPVEQLVQWEQQGNVLTASRKTILSHSSLNFKALERANEETWENSRRSLATGNCIAKLRAKALLSTLSLSRGSCPNQNPHYCLPVRFRLKHELFLYTWTKVFSSFASHEELSESFGEQNEWFHFSDTTGTHKPFLSLVWLCHNQNGIILLWNKNRVRSITDLFKLRKIYIIFVFIILFTRYLYIQSDNRDNIKLNNCYFIMNRWEWNTLSIILQKICLFFLVSVTLIIHCRNRKRQSIKLLRR